MSQAGRDPQGENDAARQKFALLVLLVVLVAAAGMAGIRFYRGSQLPSGTGVAFFALAAAAGMVAFFAPCSFGLLFSFLSRQVKPDPAMSTGDALRRALVFGGSMDFGAAVFVLGVGLLIALAGQASATALKHGTLAERILLHWGVGTLLIGRGRSGCALSPGGSRGVS